ncbi:MAG: DUF5320 domain-containing protein [Bacillota bacterium]
MPRVRFWYSPGFWKDAGWYPGAGGFRGGWSGYDFWWGQSRGFCQWRYDAPIPYYTPARINPKEEKSYLEKQLGLMKSELAEMEQRIAELNES